MKVQNFALMALSSLLFACGGSNTSETVDAAPSRMRLATAVVQVNQYRDAVQQLYLAYFGRAADPTGLANFQAQMAALGAPNDVQLLNAAYHSNAGIRDLVDSFSVSPEALALYSGTTEKFVTAIYANILSRAPNPEGLNFWVNAIDSGVQTRGGACLAILAGALINTTQQGLVDAKVIMNKLALANRFNDSLAANSNASLYAGSGAAATVRQTLSTVSATMSDADIGQLVNSIISTLSTAVTPNARISGPTTVTVNSSSLFSSSASFNPVATLPLSYSWRLLSSPSLSNATLLGVTTSTLLLIPDRAGNYVIELTVSNGRATNTTQQTLTANAASAPPTVPSPTPVATAICKDGSYSYSATRSGACSHHGGVRVWL